MMRVVLKVYDLNNPKSSMRVMKVVCALEGVECLKVEREKKTLTVVGNMDPYNVVCKLRKLMDADIEYAGLNKEENKEDEGKKKKEAEAKAKEEEILRNYFENIGYYGYYWPSLYPR